MKLKTILGVALAAGSLASCSVEDNETTASQVKEEYTRQFIKEFGTINPNQDWSVVETKSITVDLPTASNVKVYEKQGNEYRLAANYKDVKNQTITFDGMEGDDTPFLVYVDDDCYVVENGQTLTVGSAAKRGAMRASKVPDNVSWITHGNARTFSMLPTDRIMENLAKRNGTDIIDIGTVSYLSSGDIGGGSAFRLYPVYWNSPKKHVAGIYYKDPNSGERVHVPMFADKEENDEDLSFTPDNGANWYPVEADAENCWHYSHTNRPGYGTTWDIEYTRPFQFRSSPYIITPPSGISVGLYVEVDGKKYYSEGELNEDNARFFATASLSTSFYGDGYSYYCFDDPDDNGKKGDNDYNDLIFCMPVTYSPTPTQETEWIIACEDLGGTFDYDFNDIVFRVRHAAGNSYATIEPLAAGGTLPAQLYYNNMVISEEWHKHFGAGHEPNVMINTGKGPEEHAVKTIRLEGLPTDWSIKALTDNSNGLKIKVTRANGEVSSVTGPEKGAAPQMLILPSDWQWPKELTHITKAYTTFGEWGANYTNSSWLDSKVTENVVSSFDVTSNGQNTYVVK